MLVKILGFIDVFAGLILLFGSGIEIPFSVLIILGTILIIKSFFGMFKEIGSWIDFLCGVILLILSMFSVPAIINVIFGVLILQKGIVSFL